MTRLVARLRERRPTYALPEPSSLTLRRADVGAVPAVIQRATPAVSSRTAGSRLGAGLERGRARGGRPCRVLLAAEASQRTAQLTVMLLEAGHQVTVVADGFELLNAWTFAWLVANDQPFDLIVTEGTLPLLNGQEAILELQQFSDCQATCVVAVGGVDWDADEVAAQVRDALWPGPAGAAPLGRASA